MKRQLIALIAMLVIGLQGSVAAYAAMSAPITADCETSANSSNVEHKSCCPTGVHTMSCCLDLCLTAVGLPTSPRASVWFGGIASTLSFSATSFSSRGDSPLIRPPIL